jgi:hypothetical protein
MTSSPPPGRITSRTEKPLEALRTERRVLVALTPELARAALEDRAKLGPMVGAHVPESWPGADIRHRGAVGSDRGGPRPSRNTPHHRRVPRRQPRLAAGAREARDAPHKLRGRDAALRAMR